MCVCVIYACLVPRSSDEGVGVPGIGIRGGCEPFCEFWELIQVLCKSNKYSYPLSISPAPNTPGLFMWFWDWNSNSNACKQVLLPADPPLLPSKLIGRDA